MKPLLLLLFLHGCSPTLAQTPPDSTQRVVYYEPSHASGRLQPEPDAEREATIDNNRRNRQANHVALGLLILITLLSMRLLKP